MHRLIALFTCLACFVSTTLAEGPGTRPTGDKAARFPTFGVQFELPPGWSEIPREKSGRVGQWISPDSKPSQIKSLIMIESARAGSTAPATIAKNLARNFGGIVMDDPTTLGGDAALVVRAENHDDELAPVFGLVCIHESNVYLIMGGAAKDRDLKTEIETIRKNWKWIALEKPLCQVVSYGHRLRHLEKPE